MGRRFLHSKMNTGERHHTLTGQTTHSWDSWRKKHFEMLFAALSGTQGILGRCLYFSDNLEIPLKQLQVYSIKGMLVVVFSENNFLLD